MFTDGNSTHHGASIRLGVTVLQRTPNVEVDTSAAYSICRADVALMSAFADIIHRQKNIAHVLDEIADLQYIAEILRDSDNAYTRGVICAVRRSKDELKARGNFRLGKV